MNRATFIIIIAIGALMVGLWAYANQPDHEPVWPDIIQGMAFSPYHSDQDPAKGQYPSVEQIQADLELLSGKVHAVRTYSVAETLGLIPRLAEPLGINVTVGIWLSDDKEQNRKEINRFKELYSEFDKNIIRVIVGNEVLLRKELTEDELIEYIQEIQHFVGWRRVSTAETWDRWIKNPKLAAHVDFITAHILPYWEFIPTEGAEPHVWNMLDKLKETYPDKDIILGEVGWPSKGRSKDKAVPSTQNQAKFLRRFTSRAEQEGVTYYVLEAFDQVWKTSEGAVGRYWGVYDADRKEKFNFSAPVTPIPEWPQLVLYSMALALLILAFMLKDSQGLNHRGRSFLVIISYAIATFVVWLVYDYSQKYLNWQQVVVGLILLTAVLAVVVVLIAEAHEWAEAIWSRGMRRESTIKRVADAELPMVSIHLPAYNEPSDMLIKTLEGLKRLDYPHFEVIVIDNNTKDEAVWRPVHAWCETQDERFRFFHEDPLSGFKAGALNFALEKTDPRAEVVAVIDSDYIVEANWLRDLVPLFEQKKVAIVQAPQDYRDGNDSLFKSLSYCEYAGFFHLGMVTRNERNAIIQHGTMTMVRKSVLQDVGGWPTWCITEDAELGLTIFEKGHEALYVPHSYGQGVMPDNFLDYKKQRFRWAYGSILIMRHHLRYLLGLSRSKLSAGQRYHFVAGWLPWITDGLSLLFNFIAIVWSMLMIFYPDKYMPPDIALSLVPIAFLTFKSFKLMTLYRYRMKATVMQTLAAGLAGLSLSHTISRAILAGLFTKSIGFFRTPKNSSSHGFWRALSDVREELLLALLLLTCIVAIAQREDGNFLDTQLWMVVLAIQSLPYLASILVSLISAYPRLSSRIIGEMPRISQNNDSEPVIEEQDDLLVKEKGAIPKLRD